MSQARIVTGEEDGSEDETTISEHMETWHQFGADRQWDDGHLERVHDHQHAHDGETFDYHAHPVNPS